MLHKISKCIMPLKEWVKAHKVLTVGSLLGLIGGVPLFIVSTLASFFIERLILRMKKDTTLESRIENPFASKLQDKLENNKTIADEPFKGALLIASLGVYCTGNPEFAGRQLHHIFSHRYTTDWVSLSRIASRLESLNGDLITECLAVTLLQTGKTDSTTEETVPLTFRFLSIVEYGWNYERGRKPSEYLATLLHTSIRKKNETLEDAYLLLGIPENAPIEMIKASHRNLVSLYHPDTLNDLTDEQKRISSEMFLRIQSAYENIITDRTVSR